MAVKTFTTGEVLTASDTNTYLNNGGLVYITSTTIGSAVSSVTVSNVFSSTYDNYKIVVNGGVGSTAQAIRLQLGSSATGYNYATLIWNYGTGALTTLNSNAGTLFDYVGESNTNYNNIDLDVFSPNLAKYTTIQGFYIGAASGGVAQGVHAVATAYTAFTISVTGTMTGGTVFVYGYRKA